ncbi:pyruvoyl-dependent arginine decarboxylase [Desulfohalobium retbaense]|uniref:Pyruvoyl-dependent arginine decarboxylase AaxB n=1 Tax=Desulfohalobium retbaense (strain ATCC 49708 / DSM 5692 / JCM 16813 / HR100) TaxID=485915 RepID=C8X2F5_DESRD|nr:arginine decarboxylase, pyruvoyl-dependent [Desulfohalobium retbaense]ACV68602.1 arginine decarboxylase, pyruvoyl-dependent [Desulfohalobium retbaense DSM 5692]
MTFVPSKAFFTKGIGRHKNKLQSFELALRDARIEKQNLVYVSSIFPPKCKIISVDEGVEYLYPGQITFCVMARNATNEKGRLVGSAVGMAFPADESHYGYISEHHAFGAEELEIGDFAEDLASTMLATTLGIDFDPEKDYDERKQIYHMSGKIIDSASAPCVTRGQAGLWTTTISAAVFIP